MQGIEVVHATQAEEGQLNYSEELQSHNFGRKSRESQKSIAGVCDSVDYCVNFFLNITNIRIDMFEGYCINRLCNSKGNLIYWHLPRLRKPQQLWIEYKDDISSHQITRIFKFIPDYTRIIDKLIGLELEIWGILIS